MDSLESLMEQATVQVEALSDEPVETGVSPTIQQQSVEEDSSEDSLSPTIQQQSVEDFENAEEDAQESSATPTALDEAYRLALAEKDATIATQQRRIAASELAAQAPRLMAFEDLNEQGQALILDEATRAGVDVQTVLYSLYREQRAEHQRQMDALEGSIASQQAMAKQQVRDFILNNEHVASLSPEERDAFVASIGKLDAIDAIDDLHATNPQKWARAVTDIARREIVALAAKKRVARNESKAHADMKRANGGGKAPAQKVQSTPNPYADMDLASSSWDSRLKITPRR